MVSSPGMATRTPAEVVGERGRAAVAIGRTEARVLARHDQRTAAPAQSASGVQQRVPVAQMGEGVERDLDDVRLAGGGKPVEGVDVLQPLLHRRARRGEAPAPRRGR